MDNNNPTRVSTEKSVPPAVEPSWPPPTGAVDNGVPPYTALPGSGVHAGPWADVPGAVPPPPAPRTTLRRSRSDRMIAGVCGGLARTLDVDAVLIRVGLVLLTVFGVGAGAVAYLAAWILVPEED